MYDEQTRSESDNVFYKLSGLIALNLGAVGDCRPASLKLDMRYSIDFIWDNVAISYRTVSFPHKTFTLRIPPHGKPEIEKISIVEKHLNNLPIDKYYLVVTNLTLNKIFWCTPSDILCVPNDEYIIRQVEDSETRMHVIYHNDILYHGGNIGEVDVEL